MQIKIGEGEIPAIGFGTWQLKGTVCLESVTTALNAGYTHIDTADVYGNHAETGAAIKQSGISRDQLFLTSKIWRTDLKPDTLKDNVRRFLDELQTDYLDLLLIHWPNSDLDHAAALKAMTELKAEGLLRHTGVSNFTVKLLEELLPQLDDDVVIANNQVELHPSLYQKDLIDYCQNNGISVTAYSPIAQGDDLKLPQVIEIADKHDVSTAQVVLAWLRQLNIVSIPRSSSEDHIKDNLDSLQLELTDADMQKLGALNTDHRIVNPEFGPF